MNKITPDVETAGPLEAVREHALDLLFEGIEGRENPSEDLAFQHVILAKDFVASGVGDSQSDESELGIHLLLAEVTSSVLSDSNSSDSSRPVPMLRSDACNSRVAVCGPYLLSCLLIMLNRLPNQFALWTGARGDWISVSVKSDEGLQRAYQTLSDLIPSEANVTLKYEDETLTMSLPRSKRRAKR